MLYTCNYYNNVQVGTGLMLPSLRIVIVLEWENGRIMVGFGRESGRSFPLTLRQPLNPLEMEVADSGCCWLRTEGTGLIPVMIEHAEVGVAMQGGVALLIELDWKLSVLLSKPSSLLMAIFGLMQATCKIRTRAVNTMSYNGIIHAHKDLASAIHRYSGKVLKININIAYLLCQSSLVMSYFSCLLDQICFLISLQSEENWYNFITDHIWCFMIKFCGCEREVKTLIIVGCKRLLNDFYYWRTLSPAALVPPFPPSLPSPSSPWPARWGGRPDRPAHSSSESAWCVWVESGGGAETHTMAAQKASE